MDLFKVQTLDAASEMLQHEFPVVAAEQETLPLINSRYRILAVDVMGMDPVPHFSRSVVDGYAVKACDTFGAGDSVPAFLTVGGSVEMGQASACRVDSGGAVYVPTGGALPAGADAVVMIEYAERFGNSLIAVVKPAAPGENILGIGEDLPAGERLMPRGQRLRPQDIGVLAASGIFEVPVFRKLRVAIISTGDEIVAPDRKPGAGQVRDINTYTLRALAEECGADVSRCAVVGDDLLQLRQTLEEALHDSDVILLSGGSSVGEKDHTSEVLASFPDSKILTHGLAVKPGKPTVIARVQCKPVFGLPGQPASAMMVFKAVVDPFLRRLSGESSRLAGGTTAAVGVNMPSAPGRTTFQMVTLHSRDGILTAMPVHGKSGMISLMSRAHGYIRIEARQEGLVKGQLVQVEIF